MAHTMPETGPSNPRASNSQDAVPKPTEAFADYIETVTAALDRVTSLSAKLPSGSDLAFHRTMEPSLARGLDDASGQVLQMAERLLSLVAASQTAKVKGKRRKLEEEEDVVAGFRRAVGGVVDGLLEDADSQLDELRGDKKKAAIVVDESAQAKHAVSQPVRAALSVPADLAGKKSVYQICRLPPRASQKRPHGQASGSFRSSCRQ